MTENSGFFTIPSTSHGRNKYVSSAFVEINVHTETADGIFPNFPSVQTKKISGFFFIIFIFFAST